MSFALSHPTIYRIVKQVLSFSDSGPNLTSLLHFEQDCKVKYFMKFGFGFGSDIGPFMLLINVFDTWDGWWMIFIWHSLIVMAYRDSASVCLWIFQSVTLSWFQVYYLRGIEKLLQLLRGDNEEVQCVAAGALRNVVYQSSENKMEVKEKDGLTTILHALKSNRNVATRRELTGQFFHQATQSGARCLRMFKSTFSAFAAQFFEILSPNWLHVGFKTLKISRPL